MSLSTSSKSIISMSEFKFSSDRKGLVLPRSSLQALKNFDFVFIYVSTIWVEKEILSLDSFYLTILNDCMVFRCSFCVYKTLTWSSINLEVKISKDFYFKNLINLICLQLMISFEILLIIINLLKVAKILFFNWEFRFSINFQTTWSYFYW